MFPPKLASTLMQFVLNRSLSAKPRSRRLTRKHGSCGTEQLEVRQLLTGDFVFATAIQSTSFESPATSNDLAVDSAGSTLVASDLRISNVIDPGNDETRGYVTKLSASGALTWHRELISSTQLVDTNSIAVDAQQNIYVTGRFLGIVDFDPGAGTTTLDGGAGSDYVWKLNPAGDLVWVRQLYNGGSQLVVSPAGNVYVTGYFQGTYDFDSGPGVVELTSATLGSFVLKYDSAGTLIWGKQYSSSGSINTGLTGGDAMEIDSNENLYVSGTFLGTADLDPGSGVFTVASPGVNKAFLTKLTSAGNLTWAIVQDSKLQSTGIAVDGSGNVFLSAQFTGTVDANPGAGNWSLFSSGSTDMCLTKLDSGGAFVWARRFGGTGQDFSGGVAVDAQGNPHLTGSHSATVDFDPGPGIVNKTSAGQFDPFVLKVTSAAEFGWVRTFAGSSSAFAQGIVVDSSGLVTTSGLFTGPTDFDPGLPTYPLDSEHAVYVSRLSPDFRYQATAAGADDMVLRKNGSNLELFDKVLNQVMDSHPISQIRNVTINGQFNQADTLTIDMAFGGAFGFDNSIKFEGGAGGNDKIQIIGVSGQSALYRPSTTANGLNNLLLDSKPINFSGTEAVVMTGMTTLNIQTQGSADVLTMNSAAGINGAVASRLTGTSGGVSLWPTTFHQVRDVIVDTGAKDTTAAVGNDAVTINQGGLKAAGLQNLTITTGIGNDQLSLNATNIQLGAAGGTFSYLAGLGTDSVAATGNTNWTLTTTSLTAGGGGVLQLNSVESSTLTGGSGNNTLNAALFNGNVTLNGLAGNDILFAALRSSILNGGDDNDQLHGGLESDVLNCGRGVDQVFLRGTNSADSLSLQKTSTGGVFRRRIRATGALQETDTITADGSVRPTISALGGDDLISIDLLFTQGGTVDGGLGSDTCTAPGNWRKISC